MGKSVEAHEQCSLEMKLVEEKILEHRVLVARIREEITLGQDFIKEHEIKLDMEARLMHIKKQELSLLCRAYSEIMKDIKAVGAVTEVVVYPSKQWTMAWERM